MHLWLYFAKYFLLGFIFGKLRDREIMEEKKHRQKLGVLEIKQAHPHNN